VFLLIMIIPLLGRYMRILNRVMRRIHINESLKKVVVLIFVAGVGRSIIEWGYVTVFMYFMIRVLGTVILGVYVFITIGAGLWLWLISYTILGVMIQDNYKVLGVRILPLIVFFVKICGSYLLI
jgi:hypothetical protein